MSKSNENETTKVKKSTKMNEKIFEERQSLIIEMFEVQHIRNLQYFFIMMLFVVGINQIADGILHENRWSLHIDIIYENFADGVTAMFGWFQLLATSLLVYPVFQLWAILHKQIAKTKVLNLSWNSLVIFGVLAFYCRTFAWTIRYTTENNLTFTSSFALAMETARFLMKTHGFIRENAVKVLRQQKENEYKMPTFFHYCEYLFFPTLIYRDSYPRTKSVNWRNVLIFSAELCGVVVFLCYIHNLYFGKECNYFKTTQTNPLNEYLWLILRNTLPSLITMLVTFYFIIHLWQNLFAELTRFADRRFYQDWWNATSYDEYYRKWNIFVHDWLYYYVYRDTFNLFKLKSAFLPKLFVFLLSSLVHEYVLYCTMRMFYPVLFVMFFFCAIVFTSFRSPKNWVFSALFLYGQGIGYSILLTSYINEYCLRQNPHPCVSNSTLVPFDWFYSKTLFNNCN